MTPYKYGLVYHANMHQAVGRGERHSSGGLHRDLTAPGMGLHILTITITPSPAPETVTSCLSATNASSATRSVVLLRQQKHRKLAARRANFGLPSLPLSSRAPLWVPECCAPTSDRYPQRSARNRTGLSIPDKPLDMLSPYTVAPLSYTALVK